MLNLLAQVEIGKEFYLKRFFDAGPARSWFWSGFYGSCYQTISGFISCILPNIYVFSSIILFIYLLFSGIIFIKSAGSGDQEKTKKSQQAIAAALIGFLIIFASYWIIQIIEKITGLQIFSGHNL